MKKEKRFLVFNPQAIFQNLTFLADISIFSHPHQPMKYLHPKKESSITFFLSVLFSATVPTVIVLSGIIGGLVLTVVVILIGVLFKRSKNAGAHSGCPGGKNGSDIVVISKDINKGSDGLSNNSSEMKVEVRTSSSLSNTAEDPWEGSDDSGPRRQIIMPKSVDLVDGNVKTTLMAATLPPYNKAEAVSFA